MDNDYRFRFCDDEKPSINDAINRVLNKVSEIDKFKIKDMSYRGDRDFEFSKKRHIIRKTSWFKSELHAIIYTDSMFKTQRFARINMKNICDESIYDIFREELSKEIEILNKKRSDFENLHRYDYEHESR